jgi:hypothetical protein
LRGGVEDKRECIQTKSFFPVFHQMALLLISLCQFFHDTFFRFRRSTATSQLKMTFFLPALTLIIASPFISSVGSNIGKSHLSLSLSLSPVLSIDGD